MTERNRNERVFRRTFFKASSVAAAAASATIRAQVATLPFENGERPLVQYPQKRPLLRLTARPPQLETPFEVFKEGIITPNDAFFVRYHLTLSPPSSEQLENFKIQIRGLVKEPLSLSVEQLKREFDQVEVVAVNQCSGNSRGFFKPRVPGGQSGNGMMGNAKWKGVPLKAVLNKVGLQAGAREATFNGMDAPVVPQTPDFIKSVDIDHALDGEVMLAYEMNGEPLPWLNGFPLRLVVPGYYGTYWVKHLHEINVVGADYNGYWMNPAYRIPDNEGACVEPGTKPSSTVPINRYNVRSFLTSHLDGTKVKEGERVTLKGLAFDGGHGITQVLVSEDSGRNWREAELGKDLGKYSFREWSLPFTPTGKKEYEVKVRALNRIGQSQPMEPLWNPAGYMRNVVETTKLISA